MIGYNNLTAYDWSHYFEGGVAFHREGVGSVRAYLMCSLTDYSVEPVYDYDEDGHEIMIEPDYEEDGRFVDRDCHALLRSCGTGEVRERIVSLRTLFESRQWVVHRFQLGYVPLGPHDLAFVGMEPRQSRMIKAMSGHNMYTHGIINSVDADGSFKHVSTLRRIQMGLTSGRTLRHDKWPDLWDGICEVLGYGKTPIFRGSGISTVELVRDMLSCPVEDRVRSVLCPDFSTAIIAHRSAPNLGYVVSNGSVLGTLTVEGSTVNMRAPLTQWTDKAARKLAREALTVRALELYADAVVYEV
jgi:hypothetical protein